MELFLAFLAGMIVMDVMWAVKMGIPQRLYYRWKHRNDPKPNYSEWSED
jgi:hypothetical protein